jgi:hypothetical protein
MSTNLFCVFKRLENGTFLRVAVRDELEQAVQLAEALKALWPGEYVVRDSEKLMPQTGTYSRRARHAMLAPLRELIWIQEPHFRGWGCSECAWVFNPSGPPVGNSFQEMKENYLRRRDEESAAHVCAGLPRAKEAGVQIIQTGQSLHRIPQRKASPPLRTPSH